MFHPFGFIEESNTGNASIAWGETWRTVNQSAVNSQIEALVWILSEFLSRSINNFVGQSLVGMLFDLFTYLAMQ